MTRETKVGLLIGMGVILLIGIIVSDTLSVANREPAAEVATHGDRSQDSIFRRADEARAESALTEHQATRQPRRDPLPASDNGRSRRQQAMARQGGDASSRSTQRQLPTALALDGRQSSQSSQRATDERNDVPSLNLSHDWVFHTPERPEADDDRSEERQSDTTPRTAQREPEMDDRADDVRPSTDKPDANPAQVVHEVRRGETLAGIARQYYGNPDQWRRLAEANRDVVGPEGQVTAGSELVIPERSAMNALRNAGFEPVGSERVMRVDGTASRSGGGEIKVGSGDTLSGLAAEHLGSATRWRELLEANRDKLDSDTALRAGMTLKLPGGSSASRGEGQSREQSRSSGRGYTVRSGDSLHRIAQRELGDSDRWREIYDANRDKLASPDSLRVGQTLRLP